MYAVIRRYQVDPSSTDEIARRIGARLLRNECCYADDARPGAAPLLGGFAVGASLAVVARQALCRR